MHITHEELIDIMQDAGRAVQRRTTSHGTTYRNGGIFAIVAISTAIAKKVNEKAEAASRERMEGYL